MLTMLKLANLSFIELLGRLIYSYDGPGLSIDLPASLTVSAAFSSAEIDHPQRINSLQHSIITEPDALAYRQRLR
eukprot:scaffold410480_cov32-Prasinocladus_malaysianus.AAC.1